MGKKIKRNQTTSRRQEEQQPEPTPVDKKAILHLPCEQQVTMIKELLQQILADPETHFKQVDSIFLLTKSPNVQTAITAIRILAQVFVGVAPLEPVDLKQNEERRAIKITKEEFNVLKFEELLVNQYERYLKMLKEIHAKLAVNDFGGDDQLYRQFKKCIMDCVLKCFQTLWNFNHFKVLCDILCRFLKHDQTRKAITKFLADKNMSTFTAKARIIAEIAGLVKQRPENTLPDDLIKIVNATFVDFRYLQKEAEVLRFQKKRLTKKLYKQKAMDKKKEGEKRELEKGSLQLKAKLKKQKAKQKLKVKEEVEKEFAEGNATLNKREVVRANSQVLQEIFYIYFKILVERNNSKYLPDILEGILTFAHLINIQLTETLISHLESASEHYRKIWLHSKNQHALEYRIRIAFTAESLLNGPLAVYNMDDLKATSALYKILRDINDNNVSVNKQQFRMIAISLEEALLKRRQLSQEVVASLLRETTRLIKKEEVPKIYLLELVRLIASKYTKVGRMFEQDNEGYGLHGYNPHSFDPQATNAINTQLVTFLRPLTVFTTKAEAKKGKMQKELVQRLLRQTFQKLEGLAGLEQLLKQDLESWDNDLMLSE